MSLTKAVLLTRDIEIDNEKLPANPKATSPKYFHYHMGNHTSVLVESYEACRSPSVIIESRDFQRGVRSRYRRYTTGNNLNIDCLATS